MGKAVSVTGGVVVLALAYVGSSWWLGQQAEKHYQTDFDKIVKRMGFDEVKRVGYTRGDLRVPGHRHSHAGTSPPTAGHG